MQGAGLNVILKVYILHYMDGWMDDIQGVSNAQHAPGEHASLIN